AAAVNCGDKAAAGEHPLSQASHSRVGSRPVREKPVQGRLKMGFFSARERTELGTSVEIGLEGKGREAVRHDFAPQQRPREDGAAGDLGSLMLSVAKNALQEIDDLL